MSIPEPDEHRRIVMDDMATKYMSHVQEIERLMIRSLMGGGMSGNQKRLVSHHLDEIKKVVAALPPPPR
jgi:hypothetical protein